MTFCRRCELRDVSNAPSREEAEHYRDKAQKLASWLEDAAPDGFAFFALPVAHRRRLRSTNNGRPDEGTCRKETDRPPRIQDRLSELTEQVLQALVERVIASMRRERTDHPVPLGETHLPKIRGDYVEYYNSSRCHQSLAAFPRRFDSATVGNQTEGRVNWGFQEGFGRDRSLPADPCLRNSRAQQFVNYAGRKPSCRTHWTETPRRVH